MHPLKRDSKVLKSKVMASVSNDSTIDIIAAILVCQAAAAQSIYNCTSTPCAVIGRNKVQGKSAMHTLYIL